MIRVLLADDQRVVREGLGMLVGLLEGIELVATAADGEEALKLAYEADGTTLTVQDHGAAAPVIGGRGYGLTGMRERAELLGGRLNAGPTDDGFRVELWLPLPRADRPADSGRGGPSSPLRS